MTRNRRLTCLAVAAASIVLAGCNGGGDTKTENTSTTGSTGTTGTTPPASGKKLVIGFAQIGAESAWRTAETKSVQDEAAKRGIDLKFSDAQQKQENEIKAIRSFIAQKVDGIILAPVVETGWAPVLQEAKDAHIPVVLADRAVDVPDPSLYATLIGSDFVQEGTRAGEFMVKALNGKGNIVEIEGTTGSSAAIDRKKGFDEVIAKNPGIKITKSQTGEFTRAKGKEVMEAFLKADPKGINGLFAHNDDMAIGAIQAIEEAGLKPGKDIIVVSVDGVHGIFDELVAKKTNCSVECNPLLGPDLFDAMDKALKGEKMPPKIVMKDDEFTQDNAEKLLPTRKY